MTIATVNHASVSWQEDGSPYNLDYGDVYYSRDGALGESRHVYLHGNRLPERWANHFFHHRFFIVIEAGFGTGLNFLNTALCFQQNSSQGQSLWYYAIEKAPLRPNDLKRAISAFPPFKLIADKLLEQYPLRLKGWHCLRFGAINLVLIFDDIAPALAQIRESNIRADAWYLDGFSPASNTEMWTEDILFSISKLSRGGATASTYSVAGHVRRGLEKAGFHVEKKSGFGGKREMTIATLTDRKPSTETTDLTKDSVIQIVGAGIAGCALAYELANAGISVKLFEEQQLGGTLARHPAAIASPRWSRDHSIDTQWQLLGWLRLNQLVDDQALLYRGLVEHNDFSESDYANLGLLSDVVEKRDSSWYQHLALTIHPERLCQRLIDKSKIEWISQRHQPEPKQVVIDCTGASALTRYSEFPLVAVRGQMSIIRSNIASHTIENVERDEQYRVRLQSGQLLLGATYERDNVNTSVSAQSHQFNIDIFNKRYRNAAILQKDIEYGIAGVRLSSRDHMPIVDRYRELAFLNIGHGSHGLMSAFSAALKLRTLLLGEPQIMPSSLLRKTDIKRFNFLGT